MPVDSREAGVTDRQERVPGFKQAALCNSIITMIGAGGLGGEIAGGLIRKGLGVIKIFDGDIVQVSNLNRQDFYEEDLYKNKALCLAKNASHNATKASVIYGFPYMFQEAVENDVDVSCDAAISGVDNNPARTFAAKHYLKTRPVIFTAVSNDANHGYVFIQEPGKACFGCLFPKAVNDETTPCPNTPAVKDILKVVSGVVLYAVDTLFMERKRNWNYREIYLAGFVPDSSRNVERLGNCPICGRGS